MSFCTPNLVCNLLRLRSTSFAIHFVCYPLRLRSTSFAIHLVPDPLRPRPAIIDPTKTYTLYFEGGSRGHPGIAGAGMVIYEDEQKAIRNGKKYIGSKETNNVLRT